MIVLLNKTQARFIDDIINSVQDDILNHYDNQRIKENAEDIFNDYLNAENQEEFDDDEPSISYYIGTENGSGIAAADKEDCLGYIRALIDQSIKNNATMIDIMYSDDHVSEKCD